VDGSSWHSDEVTDRHVVESLTYTKSSFQQVYKLEGGESEFWELDH